MHITPRFRNLVTKAGLSAWLMFYCIVAYSHMVIPASDHNSIDLMENKIRDRIENVVTLVSPRYNPLVRSYLRTYIESNPEKTEHMLGRTSVYFPMFEKILEEEGMPEDLKYLAIIESSLVPVAMSSSGARGLWQFMKPTAREYGLQISKYVDERMDPEKSTRAAAKYLKKLYKRFGNWELAMAAYNAGPGRVSSAIRRSGSQDYWTVSRYLPRETRAYVPGFIAANYLLNYYHEHGLNPSEPSFEYQATSSMLIHSSVSFQEINQITGISFDIIQGLNPVFTRNYIPGSSYGYSLYLPVHVMPVMMDHLGMHIEAENYRTALGFQVRPDMLRYEEKVIERTYIVRQGDNLYNLAKNYRCRVSDLMAWNGLKGSMLQIGQRLKVYRKERVLIPSSILPVREISIVTVLPSIDCFLVFFREHDNPTVLTDHQFERASIKLPEHGFVNVSRRIPLKRTLKQAGYSITMLPKQKTYSPGSIIMLDSDFE